MPLTRQPHRDSIPEAVIARVQPGSAADKAGVEPGWLLRTMNGSEIPDILAYRRELERGLATVEAQSPDGGQTVAFEVEWEDPGLEFDDAIFDGIRLCANKCEFCYVHQMPKGFRKSLYIMDDDFRTSFLYGSFVTLTNLGEIDIERIVREHLSPLYVSVHTTNEDLRRDMMRWWRLKVQNERVTSVKYMLRRLESIDLYTQMVLVPGRNDREHLDETLYTLASHDNVLAVAVVPVGLTDHRTNLPELRPFTQSESQDVLRRVHSFQSRMLAERGTRFAFASDELYLLAGEPLPEADAYEGFEMLENGVGMVRDFLASGPPAALPKRLPRPKRVLLATGKLFAPVLQAAVEPLRQIDGLELEVRALKNRTFGEVTTVTGLLAGRDFATQIEPGEADLLLVSPNVLKFGTETLLDDRTLDDLRQHLKMAIEVGGTNLAELAETIVTGQSRAPLTQFGFSTHAVKEAARQH